MKRLALLILLIPCLVWGANVNGAFNAKLGPVAAAGESFQIDDDFSTDTSGDYTTILRGITVAGGVASGNAASYQDAAVLHETTMASSDHWVEAKVGVLTVDDDEFSSPIIRGIAGATPTTDADGYYVRFTSAKATLRYFTNADFGSPTFVDNYPDFGESWTLGEYHKVKIAASGIAFGLSVDFNDDGDFEDANESIGSLDDATYAGTSVGFVWHNWEEGPHVYVDDFKAD